MTPRSQVLHLKLRDVDATRLAPRLYQGGFEAYEGQTLDIEGVDYIAMMAPDAEVTFRRPRSITLPLEDHKRDLQYVNYLDSLAKRIIKRLQAGERVLVACRQGRNRSGLLNFLVLRRMHPSWSGKEIVKHIQSLRRNSLQNVAFYKYLTALPPANMQGR